MSVGRPAVAGRSPVDIARALPLVLVAGIVIYFVVSTSGFLTGDNVKAILASISTIGIVAIGMTVIILGGNMFSLALAATMAVAAMTFLALLDAGWIVALAAALAVGVFSGAIQGWFVGAGRANPVIVTIAAGSLLEGLGLWLSNGETVEAPVGHSYEAFAAVILGIPVSVFVMIALGIVVHLIMRRTAFGRELYLVGENRPAARAAGLPVVRVTTWAFVLGGTCAAIAGILLGAQNGNATMQLQGTVTYDAFAAVLVGGTAMAGGSGSVVRSIAGALVIAIIVNLLLLRDYRVGVQILARGILVLAVIAFVARREMKAR